MICAVSPTRRWLLSLLLPFACIGGYLIFDQAPSFLQDLYDDFIGPFLIMYWFGLLFSNMYVVLVDDLKREGAAPGVIAAMAGGLALMFFIAGGGPKVIWEETWMFGAAIMPGVDIAWPYVRDRWMKSGQTRGPLPVEVTDAANPPGGSGDPGRY